MSDIRKSPSSPLLHLLEGTGASVAADGILVRIFGSPTGPMRRRSAASATLLIGFLSLFLFVSSSLYYYSRRNPEFRSGYPSENLSALPLATNYSSFIAKNSYVREEDGASNRFTDDSESGISYGPSIIDSLPILFPGWEVLMIVLRKESLPTLENHSFSCIFPNNETSPARLSATLPSANKTTFKCDFPIKCRRRLPFLSPILMAISREVGKQQMTVPRRKEIMWWNSLVYESVSTVEDVVVFAKGINTRQDVNKPPADVKCIFSVVDDGHDLDLPSMRTDVTSSVQEVLRCNHPNLTASQFSDPHLRIKVSLEIVSTKKVIPSVAYYMPRPTTSLKEKKSLCAMTMVYNSGKFLREWVTYHASIGVEKFIFYDNDSDDDTAAIVARLRDEGFDIERSLWIWPKSQEAGFSHAALTANNSCTWIMFTDVDEFVFSSSWANSSSPSQAMLPSLLRPSLAGQVSIVCNEFGPSNQKTHPAAGVTQGYTCRRMKENRHKSIVLLDAIDTSLLNVIHHFKIKESSHKWRHVRLDDAVINHYKYQAWPEFKTKFRRRVSANVVDWTKNVNPLSRDRTPGLGFTAVEPPDWSQKFCELYDYRLKMLAQKWFGNADFDEGVRMVWQE